MVKTSSFTQITVIVTQITVIVTAERQSWQMKPNTGASTTGSVSWVLHCYIFVVKMNNIHVSQ